MDGKNKIKKKTRQKRPSWQGLNEIFKHIVRPDVRPLACESGGDYTRTRTVLVFVLALALVIHHAHLLAPFPYVPVDYVPSAIMFTLIFHLWPGKRVLNPAPRSSGQSGPAKLRDSQWMCASVATGFDSTP